VVGTAPRKLSQARLDEMLARRRRDRAQEGSSQWWTSG